MSGFIHKDSVACVKSELVLFMIPPMQTAIEKGYFIEFHPLSNIRDEQPLEFNVSGNGEDYMDLSSSYLHVKVKITKSDGNDLPDNELPCIYFFKFFFHK